VNEAATGVRDATLLAVAALLGIGLSASLPWLGLPLAAAGLAGLAYRRRLLLAAAISSVGVAAVGLLGAADLVYAAPAIIAVLLAITMLPRIDMQWVGALLIGLLTLAGVSAAAVVARADNTTIAGEAAKDAATVVASMRQILGTSDTPDVIAQLKASAALMQQAIWSTYFETAVIVGVLVIAAIAWAARRVGRPLRVPPLGAVDLTPHVLWPFVVGVFALAASHTSFAWASLAGTVGLNLVLCARTLFFVQGLSMSAGLLYRSRVGRGGRILALAALAAVDAFTFAVSFAGLLDFWMNFRRLPRDGSSPSDLPGPEAGGNTLPSGRDASDDTKE
jgi:hypothetical protein